MIIDWLWGGVTTLLWLDGEKIDLCGGDIGDEI